MEKLKLINSYLEKVGAQDIKIFDLRGISSLFDYVFIATVDVSRQAAALVDYINKAKKTNEIDFRNINGEGSNWTLVDLNDVLLNIFTYEERVHYDLERLYIDVPQITLDETTDVEIVVENEVEVEFYEIEEEENEVEDEVETIQDVHQEEVQEVEQKAINVNVDLNSLTLPGLKALCKQYKVKGYSTMKKAEIVQALLDAFEDL